ncbi:hypothetical protein L3X38_001744 [Prunus dulcis]|uniref:Uncharacterized protein n=1 Tax=Prunus dulcis TaxID=3755 RepID=A0AAD4WV61_PRUDU|nr:hypothetical protein L3X38_001744 [Prunus dulcis]
MTGPPSSSHPSQVPLPASAVSPKNGEEAAGVVRTSPTSISLLRPPIPMNEPILGPQFQPLPVSFWGRSKNKSGSKYVVILRVGVWSRGFEIFRRCVIALDTQHCRRMWRRVGEGGGVALCFDEILRLS